MDIDRQGDVDYVVDDDDSVMVVVESGCIDFDYATYSFATYILEVEKHQLTIYIYCLS